MLEMHPDTGDDRSPLDADLHSAEEGPSDERGPEASVPDASWQKRVSARRRLERYWEEKRLRAQIADPFSDDEPAPLEF